MKTHLSFIPILTACGLAVAAGQEIPARVTNLSHRYGNADTSGNGLMMGGLLYYSRRTVTHGSELWRTDGTTEGTRLVGETITGTGSLSPNPGGVIDGNQLYFSSRLYPISVWRTDGTAAGTVRVPVPWPAQGIGETAGLFSQVTGGGAVFVTDTEHYFTEDQMRLWRTDGTAEGTVSLAADYTIRQVQVAGSTIWASGHRLWKSDGTPAGTVVAYTPTDEQYDATRMVWAMTDDTVLFTTPVDGKWTLHRLDAGGVTPLKETGMTLPLNLLPVLLDGDVHFLTSTAQGLQLWRSDGTADGTTLLKTMPVTHAGKQIPIAAAGGKIYFHAAPEGEPSQTDLWVSDGTEAGTLPLMRTNASSPTAYGDRLHFIHQPAAGSQQLWSTDGTVEGTVMVADLGPTSVNPAVRMGAAASGLILAGGSTVWRSDGTAAGTVAAPVGRVLVGKPINGITSTPDGQVLFSAHDTAMGRRLWKSDGTAAGTVLVEAGPPGVEGFKSIGLGGAVMLDGVRYFTADDSVHGSELWRSDGTAEGTWMVKDVLPGKASSQPQSLTVFKGEVWFAASDHTGNQRVWRTDGTDAGTRLEMNAGDGRSHPEVKLSTEWQGNLIVRFTGTSSTAGIWWTDGTWQGTGRLTEDELPSRFIVRQGALGYYWVGDELWRTDGTPDGTEMVKRFRYGARIFDYGGVVLALGAGQNGPDDAEYAGLWRIHPDGAPVRLRAFINYGAGVVSGGVLNFHVTSPPTDAGLWRSDGTVDGTYRLRALAIDGAMTAHRGRIYFCGNDGVHGEEPWVGDGTVEGTRMLADLTGDSGGSSPTLFTPAGGKVFFTATTEAEGPQLYVMDAGEGPTRYDVWLDAHRARMDGRTGRGDDADEDGFTNLQEFAFGGDPSDGAARPVISPALLAVSSVNGVGTHLSLTVPVRRGTVFTPGRPATGVADGVGYRILATEDLGGPVDPAALLEVQEDATVPPPPHPHEDYEYRTFRLVETLSARERAFLRVVTE